jgi:hypothetical protein
MVTLLVMRMERDMQRLKSVRGGGRKRRERGWGGRG